MTHSFFEQYDAIAGNSIIAVKINKFVKYHDCDSVKYLFSDT